ncbi:TetR/AcrR family transcriptional regulator [Chitinophagaceae bacterium LWZ2-11]
MSKAERTRQMIIEQAAPIFNEKGIAGTSIDDVLNAAKIAKGCLYGHFESKEELSYAAADYLLKKLSDRREATIQKPITAKEKLYALLDNHKDPLNSLINGGCPILNLSVETDDTNPVIKEKVQNAITVAIKLYTTVLKEGIKTGEFSEELNADAFAVKMFASIEGGNMICRAMNSSKQMTCIIKSLKTDLEYYCV